MNEFEQSMAERLGESWYKILQSEVRSERFFNLAKWVAIKRQGTIVYPEPEDLFKAYKLSPFDKTRVVIIGQDPYHDGCADGLCFSYKLGKKPPGKRKSLDIIFDEIEEDIKFGMYLSQDYDLKWLAEQGVFMLNTILTVQRNMPLSHSKRTLKSNYGWEDFTGLSIAALANDERPKVFMLWGSEAKNAFKVITEYFGIKDKGHLVLSAPHPAFDVRIVNDFGDVKPNYPETFRGCKHFSQCNEYLKYYYNQEIIW
jgi:uracil-DNA glycosylase